MKHFLLLLIFATILLSSGCDKEPETGGPDPSPDTLFYNGVRLFDINGAAIGCFGNCSDDMDWINTGLGDLGEAALDFNSNIVLAEPFATGMTRLSVFPMPISNSGNLTLFTDINGQAIMKIALVNRLSEVVLTQAFILTEDQNQIVIASEAFQNLPRKEIHRLHYQVRSVIGEDLYAGYGDISICDVENAPDLDDCF